MIEEIYCRYEGEASGRVQTELACERREWGEQERGLSEPGDRDQGEKDKEHQENM